MQAKQSLSAYSNRPTGQQLLFEKDYPIQFILVYPELKHSMIKTTIPRRDKDLLMIHKAFLLSLPCGKAESSDNENIKPSSTYILSVKMQNKVKQAGEQCDHWNRASSWAQVDSHLGLSILDRDILESATNEIFSICLSRII